MPTKKPRKKLNVKLLITLLLVPVILLLVAVAVGFFLHGEDSIKRLTHRNDPAYYIEKGDKLMQAGDHAFAAKQYQQAATLDTGNTKALMRLVSALENMNPADQEKAAKNARRMFGVLYRVTDVDPENEEAQKKLLDFLYEAARPLQQTDMFDQLLNLSEKFFKDHPERSFALRYRALARVELMRRRELSDLERQEAHDDLKSALKLFPDDRELISALSMWNALEASRLAKQGGQEDQVERFQTESEDILAASLAKDRDDLKTKVQLVQAFFSHGKREKALDLLAEMERELLAKPAEDVSVSVGNLLVAADTEPSATAAGVVATSGLLRADALVTAASEAYPENMQITYTAAAIKTKLNQRDEAIRLLKKVVDSKQLATAGAEGMQDMRLKMAAAADLANTYLVMAEQATDTVEREKYIAESEAVIKKLGAKLRDSALISLLEGKISLLTGKTAQAIKQFELADKKFGGRNPEAVFLSAVALQREGEVGAAIKRLERLSQADLNDKIKLRTERELARLYLQAGDLNTAGKKINSALSLSTEDQSSLLLKSEILDRQSKRRNMDRTSVADAGFTRAVDLLKPMVDSGDMKARLQLARVYRDNKQFAEAIGVLEDGLQTDPENLVLLQQLVRLDTMTGEKDRAMNRLDTAMKAMPDNKLLPLLRQQIIGGEQTEDMLETMLKEMDDPFQSAMGLYTLYKNMNREEDAVAALEKAAELKPDDEKVLSARFREAISAEDWPAAQKICDRVASLNLDEARGAFWQGQLEMAQGKYIRAASSFQTGVRNRPLYSAGWLMLGNSHRLAGSPMQAGNAYQEAIRLKPNNLSAVYNLFLVYDARNMPKMAMDNLERARQLAPNDQRIKNAYLAYLGKINPDKALTARLKIARETPDDWQNRLAAANLLEDMGKTSEAFDMISSLYKDYPDYPRVVLGLADYYRRAGDVSRGRTILENYVQDKKDAATLSDWLILARFLMSCELSQPAVEAYREAMKIEDPVKHEATRELGDWYFNNQFFTKSLPLYERAYSSIKDDPRLALRFIETLIYNNQTKRAGALLDQYVADQGENSQTALLQYIIAIQNKEFDRAETYADAAIRLGPTNPRAYLYRARLNYLRAGTQGSKRQVIRDLEKCLTLEPTLISAREMLVDSYLNDQPPQVEKAIDGLQKIVLQKPDSTSSRIRLVNLLIANSQWDEAGRQIEKGIALLPEENTWYALRASVLQKQGKFNDALPDLKKAFELAGTSTRLGQLASGYLLADQPSAAVNLLNTYPVQVLEDPMLMAIKAKAQVGAKQYGQAKKSVEMAIYKASRNPGMLRKILVMSSQIIPSGDLVSILDQLARDDRTGAIRIFAGELLLGKGQTSEGIVRLQKVRSELPKSHPEKPRLLHLLASAYQQAEKYEEAAGVYEELTALTPKDFVAFNNLAYLLCENLDRAEEAVEVATKALSLSPEDDRQKSNVLDTLGWAYYKHGDLDAARMHLADSVRYDPGLYNQYHLAQVLIDKGLKMNALSQLRNLKRTAREMENRKFESKAEKLLNELDQ